MMSRRNGNTCWECVLINVINITRGAYCNTIYIWIKTVVLTFEGSHEKLLYTLYVFDRAYMKVLTPCKRHVTAAAARVLYHYYRKRG